MFASSVCYELKCEVPLIKTSVSRKTVHSDDISQVNLIFVGWNVLAKSTKL